MLRSDVVFRLSSLAVLAISSALLLPPVASAASYVARDESELRFVGRQQGAPFTGRFESFSAEVDFDPGNPQAGRIHAEVDVRSADSRNRDRDEYMQARDFFYSRKYPTATFDTLSIAAADDGDGYQARAKLTLRGKTREVTMRFSFLVAEDGAAALSGVVLLNRLDFGIGQGEWRDTSEIGNEVRVEIELRLER